VVRSRAGKLYVCLTEPVAIEVYGDEGRRNGEVVDERIEFNEETQFLRRSNELHTHMHSQPTFTSLSHWKVSLESYFRWSKITWLPCVHFACGPYTQVILPQNRTCSILRKSPSKVDFGKGPSAKCTQSSHVTLDFQKRLSKKASKCKRAIRPQDTSADSRLRRWVYFHFLHRKSANKLKRGFDWTNEFALSGAHDKSSIKGRSLLQHNILNCSSTVLCQQSSNYK